MTSTPDLRHRGACASHDPAIFFAETQRAQRRAKTICQGCPVRAACLDRALAREELYGIWGGLTTGERRRARHQMKLPTAAKLRRDQRRETARRMFAQGRGRTEIATFLHISGATINGYLTGLDQPAA